MFNADQIAKQTVMLAFNHLQNLFMRLSWQQTLPPDIQIEILQSSPVAEEIKLLVRVANREIDRATADEMTVGEVAETIQDTAELLFSQPGSNAYSIPDHFWSTPLGQVIRHCQLWLRGDDLISHTEAAQILYGAADKTELMRIKRLIERGELIAYEDPGEPNPRHAQRVSRQEVEQIKK